jgi:signal transduction histidine kinase
MESTRCEAGRQNVQSEPLDLARLAGEHWRPLAAPTEQKELDATFQISIGTRIETDRVSPGFILTNLLSNAAT